MCLTLMRFYTAPQVTAAIQALAANGCKQWETFSPHPLEGGGGGLFTIPADTRILSRAAFMGGLFGFLAALAMQVIPSALLYPLSVGGKSALSSLPAFLPIAIESMILFAAGGAFIAFLVKAFSSRKYPPLFDLEEFRKASRDAYFVAVYCQNYEASEKAAHFLTQLGGEKVAFILQ